MRCAECGSGTVVPLAVAGRATTHRFLPGLPVPADLLIPTCDHCGAEWYDAETAARVTQAMDAVWRAELDRARVYLAQAADYWHTPPLDLPDGERAARVAHYALGLLIDGRAKVQRRRWRARRYAR